MRLSIVVNMYNTALYMPKCLDSLLNQDIPSSDYEIILVNDGSTDNSLNIIKEYAPKEVSEEEIVEETERIILKMGSVTMKDMKNILSEVQKKYPTANGKIVSQVVKSHC